MSRVILAVSALLLTGMPTVEAPAAAPEQASEGGVGERCQNQQSRRRRGNLIGGLGSRVLGRAGVPTSVAGVGLPTQELLSEAITSLLDCREQQQAAQATDEALRGGAVGSTSSWQSESRPGVSGSSTVTERTEIAGGDDCMTVTDIVIVDGEETRAPKRMCRRPPRNRYVRV
jgi:surface antigen